jgi:hypothetical protein
MTTHDDPRDMRGIRPIGCGLRDTELGHVGLARAGIESCTQMLVIPVGARVSSTTVSHVSIDRVFAQWLGTFRTDTAV